MTTGWWVFSVTGACVGLLSGLLGVGGGSVMVPAFSEILGMPIKRLIATSLVIVAILSVPSTITHAFLNDINWRVALWLTIGVVPSARIGSIIAIKVREHIICLLCGIFLFIVGAVYGVEEVLSLVINAYSHNSFR
jgi:uncharacterized membrane protein YfcA